MSTTEPATPVPVTISAHNNSLNTLAVEMVGEAIRLCGTINLMCLREAKAASASVPRSEASAPSTRRRERS